MKKRDKSEFVDWATEYLRYRGRRPGEREDLESFSVDVAIEGLAVAYEEMALDIYAEHMAEKNKPEQSILSRHIPKYEVLRQRVFDGLLFNAIEQADFTLLLSTIHTFNDPLLAQKFLDEYRRRNQKLHGLVAGNKHHMQKTIENRNKRSIQMRAALKNYAARKRNIERKGGAFYRKGVLGSIATGIVIKTNIGLKTYIEKNIIGPVINVSHQPSVRTQLINASMQALPLEV